MGGPFPPRRSSGVQVTPGLQTIVDQINSNQLAIQEAKEGDDSGPFGIGKAFKLGSQGFATAFRGLGDGVGYAMKALALTNEWVAKPYLGMSQALGDEITAGLGAEPYGEGFKGFNIKYYKQRWEDSDYIPPTVKFAAEFAADPLIYVGIGAWKTPVIKLSERLSVAAQASGAGGKANFIQKAFRAARAEWGFSKEGRTLVEKLAKGDTLTKGQFSTIVTDAVKTGVLPKAMAGTVVDNLYAGRMLSFSALRPGFMARLTAPTRVARIFAPFDVFAEEAWGVPFRAGGKVLSPMAEPAGRHLTSFIDSAGKHFPIRTFTWLGSKAGPQQLYDVDAAAKAGKLATWLFRPTDHAVELEASRLVTRVSNSLDQAAANLKMDPYEVMLRLRLEDQAVAHGVEATSERITDQFTKLLDDTAFDSLFGGLRNLTDDQFIKLTRSQTDEELRAGILGMTKNWFKEAYGIQLFEKPVVDLTPFNRFWGWTGGLVNKWRPVVTSLNPSFQFLNVLSDLTERGGSGLVLRGNAPLVQSLIDHGAPPDLVSSVSDDFGEMVLKAFKGDEDAILGMSQFGIKFSKTDPNWIRAAKAATSRADHGAQAGILHRETSNAWLEMVGTSTADDPIIRVRQFVEELEESGLNPEVVQELKQALPVMSRNPEKAAQQLAEAFSYENITKEHLMGGEAFRSMTPRWQQEWGKEFDASLKDGWDPLTAATRASDHADSVIPEALGEAYKNAVQDVARVEKIKDGMFRGAGITGLRDVRTARAELMRKTMQGYAAAVSRLDENLAANFYKGRIPSISLAARQVDAVTSTAIAVAARERGLPGMMILPAVESWDQRVVSKIAGNMDEMASTLPKYRKAMQDANFDLAAKHLRTLNRKHGDFGQYIDAPELPLPEVLEEQFRVTGDRIWSQYLGEKYELADNLIAMMGAESYTPKDIVSIMNKAESEVFARGNVAALREKWSRQVARWSGNEDITMPGKYINRNFLEIGPSTPGTSPLHADLARTRRDIHELRFELKHMTGRPFSPEGEIAGGVPELEALRQRERAILDRLGSDAPPDFGIQEVARDDRLGTHRLQMPDNEEDFLIWKGRDITDETGRVVDSNVWIDEVEVKAARQGQGRGYAFRQRALTDIQLEHPMAQVAHSKIASEDGLKLANRFDATFHDLSTGQALTFDEAKEALRHGAQIESRTPLKTVVTPPKKVSQFYLDMQNNYDLLGKASIDSVRGMLPDQYGAFLMEQSGRVRQESLKLAANTDQNQKGAQLAQELISKYGTLMKRDKQLQARASKLYREALQGRGLTVMRQRMVDYTHEKNIHKTVGSLLPFAAFQLHLPGYLARTFMERPGVIAAMNHFAQEANKNHGVTGGVLFGGGFVFAPQLRFSYLPLLAGNNFVNPGDHPLNQMNDMLSAFGFSPGPDIQIMSEVGNKFASQVGLGQAAPEFRGGLLPQWRFVQDITSIMGIDGGRGLSVPFLGPSADIREREVRRVLTGKLSDKIAQFRRKNGREPYPDEVTAMREHIWQNETTAARREVSMRDLPAFLLPGVKAHDPSYTRVRERTAFWMNANGLEGVTAKNVVSNYRKLNKLQKSSLLQMIPEFQDVLSIPPYQESQQDKQVREARESFFQTRDKIMGLTAETQRKLDAALEAGTISPIQYRSAREDLRSKLSGALNGLEQNPDFKPYLTRERTAPSEPGELAYMDYIKLEPQDLNGNGVIDSEDMRAFFQARRQYIKSQPQWVQDYVRMRQESSMTPTEIEFTRAQSTLNDYFEIPKYLGMNSEQSDRADAVLAQVRALARAQPGQADLTQLLLTLPGVAPQDRLLALQALRSARNPARWIFWQGHEELELFYPDLRPAEPFNG